MYIIKRILIICLILILSLKNVYGAASGDWIEDFDDQDLTDSFDYYTGNSGSGTYTASYIDRAGGKAYDVQSVDPEVIPIWFGLSNNFGVRWKFDLWIGTDTGSPKHSANSLKFIHYGSDPDHDFLLAGVGVSDPLLRQTNLTTGAEMPSAPVGLPTGNLYLRIQDTVSGYKNINYTNLDQLRESWVTVEFEIQCGNPSYSKIWVNDVLDFYRVSNGGLFYSCWTTQMHFVNYSASAGGDVHLAVDNFFKYDNTKPTEGIIQIPASSGQISFSNIKIGN